MKNERGYALLTVLLIVLLFSTLGLGLMTINSTAAKQFNQKEIQTKSRHLAEMGVLHYQAEIKSMVTQTKSEIEDIKNKYNSLSIVPLATLIHKENEKLCTNINNFSIPFAQSGQYQVDSQPIDCPFNSEKVILAITSKGNAATAGNNESVIHAELYIAGSIAPPSNGGTGNSTLPTEPSVPSNGVITEWPCIDKKCDELKIQNFVNADTIHLFNLPFLVENSIITNNLTVQPGNISELKVLGDLFIRNSLTTGSHACIEVLGDFTAGLSIDLQNKGYIYIHGNANFPTIEHKNNYGIYVAGDVYINGVKQVPNGYDSVPVGSGCNFPEKPIPPKAQEPTPWSLDNEIKVDYIK